jgi:hypothetical protein
MPPEPDLPADNPPPAEHWTLQEKWVWACALAGEVADFNVRYGEAEPLAPKKDDPRWADPKKPRLITGQFLLDVLGDKPELEATPPRGLRIVGARFASDLDLRDIHVEGRVWLDHSRFESTVSLVSAKFDKTLSLESSVFMGDVNLASSKFDGQLNASGATFEAGLIMNMLTVGQALFLSKGARFVGDVDLIGAQVRYLDASHAIFVGDVNLAGAKIDGQLDARGATFEAGLNMNSLTVRQGLLLSDGARFVGEVNLAGAKLDGWLDASGATFVGNVNLMAAKIDGHLEASDARFGADVWLIFAEVGPLLNLSRAKVDMLLDATGMTVAGELRLVGPLKWGDHARFVLRNARVGVLYDGEDAATGDDSHNPWPESGKLEINGFTYGRLGGGAGPTELRPRPVGWYVDWLARDTRYAPQPYQQLASVFRASGDTAAANAVLYAARERERTEAREEFKRSKTKAGLSWLGLELLKWTIGYGLGGRYFRALVPVGVLTFVGAVVLWTSGADTLRPAAGIEPSVSLGAAEANLDGDARPAVQDHAPPGPDVAAPQAEPKKREGFVWCLWASFDWTLPLIELDEAHTDTIAKLQGGPYYWLYIQALLGYVLAGFIGAGLAGLTQSRG